MLESSGNFKRSPFNLTRFKRLGGDWAARVQYFPSIGSTNLEARRQLRIQAEPLPMLLLTDQQLEGRGRLGRSWQAPAYSGLLFTLVFRVELPLSEAFLYSAALSLSVRQAALELGEILLDLKWPNDLLFDGKKVAGLLAELENGLGQDKNQTWMALGCGLNLNITSAEFAEAGLQATATSIMSNSTGSTFSREEFLAATLKGWQVYFARLQSDPQAVRAEWSRRLLTIGKWVEVWMNERVEAAGFALGVDEDGALIVREASGVERRFQAADVSVRLPDGRYSA